MKRWKQAIVCKNICIIHFEELDWLCSWNTDLIVEAKMYNTEPEIKRKTSTNVQWGETKDPLLTLVLTHYLGALWHNAAVGCPPTAAHPRFQKWKTRKNTTAIRYRAWVRCQAKAWQVFAYLKSGKLRVDCTRSVLQVN